MVPLLSATVGRVATLLLNWSTTKSLPHTGETAIGKVPKYSCQCHDTLYYTRKKMEAKALEGTNSLTQALRDLSIREKQQDNSPGNHSSGTFNCFNVCQSNSRFPSHYLFLPGMSGVSIGYFTAPTENDSMAQSSVRTSDDYETGRGFCFIISQEK